MSALEILNFVYKFVLAVNADIYINLLRSLIPLVFVDRKVIFKHVVLKQNILQIVFLLLVLRLQQQEMVAQLSLTKDQVENVDVVLANWNRCRKQLLNLLLTLTFHIIIHLLLDVV